MIATANDPLVDIRQVSGSAEVRYGPAGAKQAEVVRRQVPGAKLYRDVRADAVVDLALGPGYRRLSTPAELAKRQRAQGLVAPATGGAAAGLLIPAPMVVLDFRPSRDGFRFGNSWPRGAPVRFAGLALGRVHGGLCGGMAYAARQAWLAGEPLPADSAAPAGGPLADRLWRAQLASLGLPLGPLRYLWFQLPAVGDRRRHRLTLTRGLPGVRGSLAAGRPPLVGLVRAVSWDPRRVVEHHVVLGYGLAERAGGGAEVAIYDPNHPGDDSVRLVVGPDGTVTHTGGSPVAAFAVVG